MLGQDSAYINHLATVRAQRAAQLKSHPLGALVAGYKMDVVITPNLAPLAAMGG